MPTQLPGSLASIATQPVIDGLRSIRVPALVIVGSEDRRFLAAKDYLADRIRMRQDW